MSARPQPIYVGSGSRVGRPAGGISVLLRGADGEIHDGGVAAEVGDVSYLAWHPAGSTLYCANGTGVTTLARSDDGRLRPMAHADFDGGAPCHLSVHPSGRHLLSADYAAGILSVHELGGDGAIGRRTHHEELTGSGPDPRRQERAHPHQIVTTPGGRHVLATDLGADAVYAYTLDAETGCLHETARTSLHPGTGPRHLAFASPSLLYVVGELDATVTALRYAADTGELREVSRSAPLGAGAGARAYPSTVVLAPGARYLYIGIRGADALGVVAADGDGKLGEVRELPSGGGWPIDLTIADGTLYVANTRSDTVCAFRIEQPTGRLEAVGEAVNVAAPSCLAPLPPA